MLRFSFKNDWLDFGGGHYVDDGPNAPLGRLNILFLFSRVSVKVINIFYIRSLERIIIFLTQNRFGNPI